MKTNGMRLLAVLLAASLLAAMTGCGPAATPAPATTEVPGEVSPTSEPTAAAEPVSIGVWTVAWSPSSQAMMATLIDMFNDEHQGSIRAEYIQGDWGLGDTYISGGVAGGGGIADVLEWYVGGGGVQSWYEQGFTVDLSPYVTDEVRATMPPEMWASRTTEDGAIFASGTVTGEELALYYNPALLAAAGVEPPAAGTTWTWDEFLANARLLTIDANGKHLGETGFDPGNVVQWGFLPRLDNEKIWEEASTFAMQASGLPMIRRGSDGTWDIFFDDAAMPVLRTYISVIQEGITPPLAVGLTGDSQDEAFAQGMAAMVSRGYFNIGVLHDRYPDFQFAVMPIPMLPGSTYYVSNSGQGFAVPVTSQHPEAAAEFVFWFQGAVPQALWASALYLAPCNPAALEDPVLADDPNWDVMRFYRSIEQVVTTEFNSNQSEFLTTVYAPNMMAVVQGQMTLDEAIAIIKASSQEILNQ
jgi:ABC-type glycerol-3-phosphate transport system substrate-binding protein